jgi:aconitate hydratase
MGMLAIGVGGSDAVDAMTGMPWGLMCPKGGEDVNLFTL